MINSLKIRTELHGLKEHYSEVTFSGEFKVKIKRMKGVDLDPKIEGYKITIKENNGTKYVREIIYNKEDDEVTKKAIAELKGYKSGHYRYNVDMVVSTHGFISQILHIEDTRNKQ